MAETSSALGILRTAELLAVRSEILASMTPRELELVRNKIKLTIASHPEIRKILQAEVSAGLKSMKKFR